MKTKEEVHPRWIGFLFWGISALVGILMFEDQMDARMQLTFTMVGVVMTAIGIWLAPTKSEHE